MKFRLSKQDKKLKKELFDVAGKQREGQLMPDKIKSILTGNIKKGAGETARTARGLLGGAAMGDEGVRSSRGASAVLRAGASRVEGYAAPELWDVARKEEAFTSSQGAMENLLNIERQIGVLKGSSNLASGYYSQLQRAGQGQALGDIARFAAYNRYPVAV